MRDGRGCYEETRCVPKLLTRIRRGGRVVILIKMFLRFQ